MQNTQCMKMLIIYNLQLISLHLDFNATCQHSAFVQYMRKKWEYNEAVHQLSVDFKKAYDSTRRGVFYNILIEFGIPMQLVRLIKMCLNKTISTVCVGKNLSDMLPIQNGLKKDMLYHHCSSTSH